MPGLRRSFWSVPGVTTAGKLLHQGQNKVFPTLLHQESDLMSEEQAKRLYLT
jgi:hypothetical protein